MDDFIKSDDLDTDTELRALQALIQSMLANNQKLAESIVENYAPLPPPPPPPPNTYYAPPDYYSLLPQRVRARVRALAAECLKERDRE